MNLNKSCPYCGSKVLLKSTIYVSNIPNGFIYVCSDYPFCNAYVGCHKGTTKPLGRLSNKKLRQLKQETHEIFDYLWKTKIIINRASAYNWLSQIMKIPFHECHIGHFDEKQCIKAIEICKNKYKQTLKKEWF